MWIKTFFEKLFRKESGNGYESSGNGKGGKDGQTRTCVECRKNFLDILLLFLHIIKKSLWPCCLKPFNPPDENVTDKPSFCERLERIVATAAFYFRKLRNLASLDRSMIIKRKIDFDFIWAKSKILERLLNQYH